MLGANRLSGSIPETWSTLPLHTLSVTRNDGVCGGVPAGVSGAVAGNDTRLNASCPWDAQGGQSQGQCLQRRESPCCPACPACRTCMFSNTRSGSALCTTAGRHTSCPSARAPRTAAVLHSFRANLTSSAGALDSWLPGTNPCGAGRHWAGVTCDDSGGVVGINLDGRGLRGPLGGGLSRLLQLQEIRVARNQLTGGATASSAQPPWRGNLLCSARQPACCKHKKPPSPTLFHAGTLPAEWAALANLTAIDVSSNKLSGPLPDSWGPALTALHRFNASGNGALNGTLPASWSRMASLQVL